MTSPSTIDGIDTSNSSFKLIFDGIIGLFWFIMSYSTINRMKKSFQDLEPETDSMVVVIWITIILVHLFGILATIPAFLQGTINLQYSGGSSGSIYGPMVVFIMYIFPILYIFKLGISGIRAIREFRRSKKSKWGLQQALLLVLFVFAWIPLLGHIVDQGLNTRDHSVYNPRATGNSEFREYFEDLGYETYAIQSSLSSLIRMNRSVCLVVFDAKQTYNPIAEIPFFIDMFNQTYPFSMLVCDDHGSTSSLMTEMFLASSIVPNVDPIPLALFPQGTLLDYGSNVDSKPTFPLIVDLASHPTTSGISQVVLSRATGLLGGDLFNIFGWEAIGLTTASYSFIDVDGDEDFDSSIDTYPIPDVLTDTLETFGISGLEDGIPLGGYKQITFAAKELSSQNRIFLTSDASMFNNDLFWREPYDNQEFASNIINWLTFGNPDMALVFDESHNAPYGRREFNSAAMFGMFQGYVNWLSINPFLSWIYPVIAVRLISRWVPKDDDKRRKKKRREKQVEEQVRELQFRTSSFFAEKINWYRINKEYNQAIILLYRRLERKINKMVEGTPSVEMVLANIKAAQKQYMKDDDLNRIKDFLKKMDDIKKNKITIVDEKEFHDMFFEMEWVNNHLKHF
jgi:hypothetical protein